MKNECIVWFGACLRSEWHEKWQRDQEVCSWLAKDNTVIYIERMNAVNLDLLRFVLAVIKRLRNLVKGAPMGAALDRLRFVQPVLLPYYFKGLDRINGFLLRSQILWHLHKLGHIRFFIWISNPSNFALLGMKTLPEAIAFIYQCNERFENRPDFNSSALKIEREIAKKANFVTTHSKVTMADKIKLNQNTYDIPESADPNLIEFAIRQLKLKAASLCSKGDIKICYFGSFHHVFDFDLVQQAAKRYKGYRFLLWGPITSKAKRKFAQFPNVELLGFLYHNDVVSRLSECDICIIPYIRNGYSMGVFPHKLFTYIASGRPIVGSRLPELERFESWLFLAEDHEEFLQLLGKAVKKARDPEFMRFRAIKIPDILSAYSQERIMERLNELLEKFVSVAEKKY